MVKWKKECALHFYLERLKEVRRIMVDSRVGMTTICGINCPYCYEEDKERITVYTGNKSIEIPDGMDKIIGQ